MKAVSEVPTGAGPLPVTDVPRSAAVLYCLWAGGRPPTEEEWWAAAGGKQAHRVNGRLEVRLVPAASSPAIGPFGVRGLAGNVHEWALSGASLRITGLGSSYDSIDRGDDPDYEMRVRNVTPKSNNRAWGIRVVRTTAPPR
jgi:formylglycine-generating enzyme required for sulfatase activity